DQYARGYRFRVVGTRKRGRRHLHEDGPAPRVGGRGGARGPAAAAEAAAAVTATDKGGGASPAATAFAGDKVKKEGRDGSQASLSVSPAPSGGAIPRVHLAGGGGGGVGVGGDRGGSGGGGGGGVDDGGGGGGGGGVGGVVVGGGGGGGGGGGVGGVGGVVGVGGVGVVGVGVGVGGGGVGVGGVGGGVGKFFSPTPLAGPRPALARGGWASLASSTASANTGARAAADNPLRGDRAADGTKGTRRSGGGGDVDDDDDSDDDDDGGERARQRWMSSAAAWVNRPASVLACLRALLLPAPTPAPTPASSSSSSPALGKRDPALALALGKRGPGPAAEGPGSPYREDAKGGGGPALVSLLETGACVSSTTAVAAAAAAAAEGGAVGGHCSAPGGGGYAAGLRREGLEQLAGKMRLLLRADLSAGRGKGGGEERERGGGGEGVKLGLGEFVSLVEDVHRSVERTTRQSHDALMRRRQASRENGLGRLEERLRRLESKRGVIQSDLDRIRRRMALKIDRIKTLRTLADECWAEGEPSIGRDSLEGLESMIRKEKVYLSKSRVRVREMEAHGAETEALLSGIKEDKVRRLADAYRREREAEVCLVQAEEQETSSSLASSIKTPGDKTKTSPSSSSSSAAAAGAVFVAPSELAPAVDRVGDTTSSDAV
ncbi:unnamed protein product, partial [Laminaria digitata]